MIEVFHEAKVIKDVEVLDDENEVITLKTGTTIFVYWDWTVSEFSGFMVKATINLDSQFPIYIPLSDINLFTILPETFFVHLDKNPT